MATLLVLTIMMSYRYINVGNFMPSGLLALFSFIMLARHGYLYYLRRQSVWNLNLKSKWLRNFMLHLPKFQINLYNDKPTIENIIKPLYHIDKQLIKQNINNVWVNVKNSFIYFKKVVTNYYKILFSKVLFAFIYFDWNSQHLSKIIKSMFDLMLY